MRKQSKLFKRILTMAIIMSMVLTSFIGVFAEGENLEGQKEVKGYVTISVEKFSLGLGYIREPVKVPFYEGDTVADLTIKVIGEENAHYKGNGQEGFWLNDVKDNEIREPNWPQHILDHTSPGILDEVGRIEPDWLSQYDYNPEASGWMYCVNGKFPDTIASGVKPKDGDVIRWQFTIVGLGRDIGANPEGSGNADSWGADFISIANKDGLTRLVSEVNSSEEKDELLKNEGIKAAYDNAKKQLEDIASSQENVDNALGKLQTAIKNSEKPELDKSKLEEAISKGKKVDLENKTEESVTALNEAIEKGKEVLVKDRTTQKEIDIVVKAIEAAIENLKSEPLEKPGNNGELDKPIEVGTTLNWPQFMGNLELQGVSDAKTPRTSEEMVLKWKYTESRGEGDWVTTPGTPIIVGDYTYCYIYEKLIKFDTSTGKIVKTAPAPGDAAFFINLAYGDGKIFVPRHVTRKNGVKGKTYLIAYDADTLEQLFVTDSIADGAQIQAQVFYNDGYVYTGPRDRNGKFAAFKTTDVDTSKSDEVVEAAWTIETNTMLGFGTNAGPAFVNGAIIFADQGKIRREGSKVWSVDAKTGEVIDSIILPNKEVVSSTIVYYPKNNRIYISASGPGSEGAVVRSYEVNSNGSFNKNSMKAYISDVDGGGTQSSPVIYNDRLYLGGGGRTMGSAEPFHVIDANTMEEIYRIDEIITKGTPILTTAYSTKENNQEVYIYLIPYAPDQESDTSIMYIVRDSIGQTEPKYEKIINVGEKQYASQSVAISPNGDMVFYNDARILYNYGNKNNTIIGAQDIVNQIERLPELAGAPYYNSFEIKRIFERYNALSDKEKARVSNFDKLGKILENVDPVEYLIKGIDSLPQLEEITLDDQGRILSLKAFYDRLSDEEKAKVTNADKLLKTIAKVEELQDYISAKGVIEAIDKIKPVDKITSVDNTLILSTRTRYDELSDRAKKLVTNLSKLEKAEEKLKKVLDQIQKVDELIKSTLVGEPITANSKPLIDSVDKAIEGLTPEDLNTITSYEQYFIPAKIDYINALINEKLMDEHKKVTVNKDNIDKIKDIIDEVETHYKSIPESELKYIENYKFIPEILEDIENFSKDKEQSLNKDSIRDKDNKDNKDNGNIKHNKQNNNQPRANNDSLPKTGSKNYTFIAVALILTGILLIVYRSKSCIKEQ
ncbi:MAG: DUF4430 domain-containing protein [Clostridiaceae bacterium]|nr:DUF4430 domain-containing protein [Clostridiaceae bacterium]MBW4860665.1 DUF4430 domain-containing protein [Clostridiaceae bacterium]MBW4868961.1 DUF4430 domain-containing protein [Clostridiaceae bacterium]